MIIYLSNRAVSVGSDRRIQIYEGKTGECEDVIEHGEGHTGSIYSCAFSPGSDKLATCSADKSVKIWDMESKDLEVSICPSEEPNLGDMQMGVIWTREEGLFSVSLNGDLNQIIEGGITNVVQGHQVSITSMAYNGRDGHFYTGFHL